MIAAPDPILFATDFSGRCDRPLARSLGLAQLWRSRLILLHVLERPPTDMTDEERIRHELRITSQLRAEAGDADGRIEARIAEGAVATTIHDVADDEGAGLVVTGVSRHDELGDFILGTTVDRLVRVSVAPVLVVKERPRSPYRRLLIATDFSENSALALQTAAAWFPEAALDLAHAYHVPFEPIVSREANAPALQAEIADDLGAFLEGLPAGLADRVDVHVDYGDTSKVVPALVRSTGADLAVIGSHGRSGFVAATLGSRAAALLESLPCDVLVVPDRPGRGIERASR